MMLNSKSITINKNNTQQSIVHEDRLSPIRSGQSERISPSTTLENLAPRVYGEDKARSMFTMRGQVPMV